MKCHRFGVEGGCDSPVRNLQLKVHEDRLSRLFAKDSLDSTCVHTVLKLFPVPLVGHWIWVMKPHPQASINEMVEILDYRWDLFQHLHLFINCHIQVGNSRHWRHAHLNPADLIYNNVTKSHAVVEYHKFKGFQQGC